MSKPLYLDHNATTPLDPRAERAMAKALSLYGNPSSPYKIGQEAKEDIEVARETIAKFVGAHSSQLIFTSGATEGNSIILHQLMAQLLTKKNKSPDDPPPHLITTVTEHASILSTCQMLESYGIEVSYIPVHANGQLQLDALENAIQPNTVLISIMWANNETGVIQDIDRIVTIAKKHAVLVHSDASQFVGKSPCDFQSSGLDFMTFSAHKCYGPKGIGALCIKDEIGFPFTPLWRGGSQERKLRAGTENSLGILGFHAAIESLNDTLDQDQSHLLELKQQLQTELIEKGCVFEINGNPDHCLPGTINLRFPGISGEALMMNLDMEKVYISTGSACSTGSLSPSHVLLAMGLDEKSALESIRISMGRYTTKDDITQFIRILLPILNRLQKPSNPY